jgi:probable rRNA maturation factor
MPGSRAPGRITVEVAVGRGATGAQGLRRVPAWARAAVAAAGWKGPGTINVRLVGRADGARLNTRWRGKAGPTNVLAFPGPDGPPPAGMPREFGDLVICWPLVVAEAAAQGKQPGRHLAHLVVHGTLHLCGHTHDGRRDAARMEGLERAVLAGFGLPDPYVTKPTGARASGRRRRKR